MFKSINDGCWMISRTQDASKPNKKLVQNLPACSHNCSTSTSAHSTITNVWILCQGFSLSHFAISWWDGGPKKKNQSSTVETNRAIDVQTFKHQVCLELCMFHSFTGTRKLAPDIINRFMRISRSWGFVDLPHHTPLGNVAVHYPPHLCIIT